MKQIKRTLEIDPRFGEAWVYLALISENFRDQASKVPEYLKKAEGQRPREKATQILLGTVYASRENFRSALRIYRRAVKIWRDDPELWYRLGTIQDRLKQFDETIYSMQRVIQLDPRFASAYNYMGYLFAEKGIRLEESLSLIEKALELEPENAYFIDSLGWVYFKLGKVDDARRELERAVSLLEDPVILEHLGDVYYALGRKEDAMKEWQKSLTLKADNASLIQKIQKIE